MIKAPITKIINNIKLKLDDYKIREPLEYDTNITEIEVHTFFLQKLELIKIYCNYYTEGIVIDFVLDMFYNELTLTVEWVSKSSKEKFNHLTLYKPLGSYRFDLILQCNKIKLSANVKSYVSTLYTVSPYVEHVINLFKDMDIMDKDFNFIV